MGVLGQRDMDRFPLEQELAEGHGPHETRMTRADIRFPADQLRPYIKALLTAMLNGVQWENDRARMGALSKEICEVSSSHAPCRCVRRPAVGGDRSEPHQPVSPRSELVETRVRALPAPMRLHSKASLCAAMDSTLRSIDPDKLTYQRIKQRMIEIEGKGFKYIVNTTFSENLGQAGRADMSCHWEDTDAAVQEMFSNVSVPDPLEVQADQAGYDDCCLPRVRRARVSSRSDRPPRTAHDRIPHALQPEPCSVMPLTTRHNVKDHPQLTCRPAYSTIRNSTQQHS